MSGAVAEGFSELTAIRMLGGSRQKERTGVGGEGGRKQGQRTPGSKAGLLGAVEERNRGSSSFKAEWEEWQETGPERRLRGSFHHSKNFRLYPLKGGLLLRGNGIG